MDLVNVWHLNIELIMVDILIFKLIPPLSEQKGPIT